MTNMQAKWAMISQKFQSIGADSDNMTALVVDLADIHGVRAAKLEALEASLEQVEHRDEQGNTGTFVFHHKGEKYHISDCWENVMGEHYHQGKFLEDGDWTATIRRVGYGAHSVTTCETDPARLAVAILNAVDDANFCSLCGQLNNKAGLANPMSGPYCLECALVELPRPCHCGLKIGRATGNEHPVCEKRRLANQ